MLYVPNDTLFINRLIIASLTLTLWLASSTVFGQTRHLDDIRELRPNQTLVREVKGSKTHHYKFALSENEFFQVRVEQKGADVVMRLVSAGGAELARMDSPNGKEGVETLTFVAAEPGSYMLEVSGLNPKEGKGNYTIRREPRRAATALDRRRVEVERLFAEAGEQGAADPSDTAIKKWEEALAGWRELQDSYMAEQAERQLRRTKNVRAKALFDAATQLANRGDKASLRMSLSIFAAARRITQETGQKENEATSLDSLARVSRALGDMRKALEYYGQALPLWVAVGDRGEEADALVALATISYSLKETRQALGYFLQALDPIRVTRNRYAEATTLNNIGNCYSDLGEKEKAIDYIKQALVLYRAIEHRQGEITALNNLAHTYAALGKKQEALDFFQQALKVCRDAKEKPLEAHVLRNIGNLYSSQEEKRQALEPYRQALSIYQALDDKEKVVDVLDELGFAHVALGEKAEAVEYFLRALPLYKLTADDWKERGRLANLASLYIDLGEKKKALEYHLKGLELNREADDQVGVGTQLNNVGMVYMALGERRKARDEYFTEALKIFEALQDKHRQAWTHVCFGLVHTDLRATHKALEHYRRALALYREVKDKTREAQTLQNIGVVYSDLGETRRALEAFEEGLRLTNSEIKRASFYHSIGNIYWDLGEKQKALEYKTRALVASVADGKDAEAIALASMHYPWRMMGKGRLAAFYGKQAVNKYQELRQVLQGIDHETQKAFLGRIDSIYSDVAISLISVGRLAEAVQVLNLYRDQQYFDFDRDPGQPANRLKPSRREAAFAARYERVAHAVGQAGGKIENFLRRFEDEQPDERLTAQRGLLDVEYKAAADAFAAVLKEAEAEFSKPPDGDDEVPPEKDVEELQKTLRDLGQDTGQKAAALYTVADAESFHILLVTPDNIKAFSTPAKSKTVDEMALRFYALLRSARYDPRPLGKQIYDIILKPAEAELKRTGTRTLLWAVSGNLRYVPMAALSPDGKGYLVEQYQNVMFTRSDRERMTRAVSRHWAGVGFGSSRAQKVKLLGTEFEFRELKGVTAELRAIFGEEPNVKGILPGTVITDTAFSGDAFFKELGVHRPLVHISSHFLFRPGDGSHSFLLLGDGTPLTLDELKGRGRVFEAVELLTLSACNTAAQRADADGREIDGFAELAQRLGAYAVMATLWPVSDKSTPHLMGSFYRLRQHAAGMTKAEALRKAQLSLLHGTSQLQGARDYPPDDIAKGASEPDVEIVRAPSGGRYADDPRRDTGETLYVNDRDALPYMKNPAKPYAHPYYWAPFVLFGNWR